MKQHLLTLMLAAGLAAPLGSAHAGFIEDFYDNAGAGQSNVTRAGLYESSSLNTVTAGGYVYKAPRRDFTPFHLTPPSLAAGCGGIDLFLGAFSVPSKDEFLAFLRSIGSALPGLAFSLALQTLSPDLSEQVTSFRDLIREYSARYQDSCTAAESLLEMTGAQSFMKKLKFSADNALRADGLVNDAHEADAKTRTNGSNLFSYARTQKDSGGQTVDAPEMNLTWTLLGGGTFNARTPKAMKELMMTLVGTTIYTRAGDGRDAVTQTRYIAGADIAAALFGDTQSVNLANATRLRCKENDPLCLAPVTTSLDEINLTHTFWTAAQHYRDSILLRNPSLVTDDEMLLLGTATTVPLIRIINTVSLHRYMGFSEDILRVYVEAAAYEAILRALDELALNMREAVTSSSASQVNTINSEHAKSLLMRIAQTRGDLAGRADRIYQQMQRTHSFVAQIEHLERSVLGNAAQSVWAQLEPSRY